MNKVLIVIAFVSLFLGCKSMNINPALANQQGEKDNNLAKLEANMSGLQKGFDEVSAKLTAQTQAVAGVNNRMESLSAGRDMTSNSGNTNDSDLMKFIFDKWAYIVGALFTFISMILGGFWGLIKFIMSLNNKTIKAKDDTIVMLMKDKADTEQRMDKFQNELINKLINGRKEA